MMRSEASAPIVVDGLVEDGGYAASDPALDIDVPLAHPRHDAVPTPYSERLEISCRRFRRLSHQGYDCRHHHPEGQLFLLDTGSCAVVWGSGRWIVRPGQPCWMPPHVPHDVIASGAVAGRSILVAERLCGSMPLEPTILARADLVTPVLERLTGEDLDPARAERLLLVLLDELASSGDGGPVLRLPSHERLRSFALVIAGAPEDGRGVEECARSLAMSSRSFSRHFARETGLPFVRWRCLARVLRAAELIRHGTSVTQAGLQVGYESQSTFSSSFRQWMGMTPSDFRKAYG